MPTYRYKCPECSQFFDVVKSVADIDSLEMCPHCAISEIDGSHRFIESRQFYGEKPDDAFYSQALGKMVKSRKEQNAEAKARGWEEVGTTDIEKHIDRTDKQREEKSMKRWDELLRG